MNVKVEVLPFFHEDEIYFIIYPVIENEIFQEPLTGLSLMFVCFDIKKLFHQINTMNVDVIIKLYNETFKPSMINDFNAKIIVLQNIEGVEESIYPDDTIHEYILFRNLNSANKAIESLKAYEDIYTIMKAM